MKLKNQPRQRTAPPKRRGKKTLKKNQKKNGNHGVIIVRSKNNNKGRRAPQARTWKQREFANQHTDNIAKAMVRQVRPNTSFLYMRDPAFASLMNKAVERACLWGLWALDPSMSFNMPECRSFVPPIKGANKASIFAAESRPSTLLQTYQCANNTSVANRFDLTVMPGSARGAYIIGAQPTSVDYHTDNSQFAFFGHYDMSDAPPNWPIPPLKNGNRFPCFLQFDDAAGQLFTLPIRANNLIANAEASQFVTPIALTVNSGAVNTNTLKYSITLNRAVTAGAGCTVALRLLDAAGASLAEAYMVVGQGSSEVHAQVANWGLFVSGTAVAVDCYIVAAEQDQQLLKFGAIFNQAAGVAASSTYKISWTSNSSNQMVCPNTALAAQTSCFWRFVNSPAYDMLTESERKTKICPVSNVFIGTLTGPVKDRGGSCTAGFMPSGLDLAACANSMLGFGKNVDRNSILGGFTVFAPQMGRPKFDANHMGGQFPDIGCYCLRLNMGTSSNEITGLARSGLAFETVDPKYSPMHAFRDEMAFAIYQEKISPYIERIYCNPSHTKVFTTFLKECTKAMPGYFHSAARILETVATVGAGVAGALML